MDHKYNKHSAWRHVKQYSGDDILKTVAEWWYISHPKWIPSDLTLVDEQKVLTGRLDDKMNNDSYDWLTYLYETSERRRSPEMLRPEYVMNYLMGIERA